MAYDEKNKVSNSENCAVHIWPRSNAGGSLRSIGRVEHSQCNNCLAMRITFTGDRRIDGEWVTVKDVQIVEPRF